MNPSHHYSRNAFLPVQRMGFYLSALAGLFLPNDQDQTDAESGVRKTQ